MGNTSHLLILGGQRSGKSRFGEELVLASGRRPVYIATATAGDDEMAERISHHRARRSPLWTTIEEPLDLPEAVRRAAAPDSAVLVDCLTLWLSNLIEAGRDAEVVVRELIAALGETAGPVVLVSNEVGSGIIPDNPLARHFADAQGRLNQAVARAVGRVVLMVAGIATVVKPAQSAGIIL
jgi:adenosylcobinamide kinase/adenosylcobinamide-phosphate guanylyltransferase